LLQFPPLVKADSSHPLHSYGSTNDEEEDLELRRDKMDTYKLLVAINDTIMKAIGLEQEHKKQVLKTFS